MARRKSKPLPRAVTERRPFFVKRFDDVILDDGTIVVLPSAVTTLASKRFADHVFASIPKTGWVAFFLNDAVHVAPEQGAFMDALMGVWPYCDELDPELAAIANELLHEFIALLKAKAPGAIGQAFANIGAVFGPVPS